MRPTDILARIAADPNLHPSFAAAINPNVHRANGRIFHSAADRDAYLKARAAYPVMPDAPMNSPAWTGFFDSERDQQARDDARSDAAFDGETA